MAQRLPWPLPAILAWIVCWLVFLLGQRIGWSTPSSLVAATLAGLLLSLVVIRWWRRAIVAAGFPLAMLASGAAVLPAWVWPLLLVVVLLVYPVKAWRDAPLFPTPPDALRELPTLLPLPPQAAVLDAGCGLGHGLRALRSAYPLARLSGIEWSWPLRAWAGLRCPWAHVRHGDIWHESWQPYALVYLFQRPESMPRAVAKARADMLPGSWLVSLEFEARELSADAMAQQTDGRPVWVYRLPFRSRPPARPDGVTS